LVLVSDRSRGLAGVRLRALGDSVGF
jgi:hypothetical protein